MCTLPASGIILLPFLASVALPCAPVEVIRWDQLHPAAIRLIKPDVLEFVKLLQVHDMREKPNDVERLRRRWVKLDTSVWLRRTNASGLQFYAEKECDGVLDGGRRACD